MKCISASGMRFKTVKREKVKVKSEASHCHFLFSIPLLMGLLLFAPCPLLHAGIQDRVVAFVDNTAITLSDLEMKYAETM